MANNSPPQLLSPSSFLRPSLRLPASKMISTPHRTMAQGQDTLEESKTPRQPLSELLGNFSYASTFSPLRPRTNSGEAATKRRRVELADVSTVSVMARKTAQRPSKAPGTIQKRTKASKKAQTITAVATKAYQPAKQPETVPLTTVSGYLAAPEDTCVAEKSTTELEKVKKPRKPRTKSAAAAGAEITKQVVKKPGRPKKTKVKVKEDEQLPSLYSPERAMSQAQRQQFLFGTSSQLALDESPAFIRQIQFTLTEPEGTLQSSQPVGTQIMVSPAKRSYAKVPTAPHGTSLSVGQGDREHWTAASRNFEGGLHRDNSGLAERPMPRKAPIIDVAAVLVQPSEQNVPSASPPKTEEWINIDDIEDETPPTPSPPRRRASASPVPLPSLTFNTAEPPTPTRKRGEASEKKATLSLEALLKTGPTTWDVMKATLFPLITTTVRNIPRTYDSAHPTWHQKILLYDPIVLEDFTAWLNEQGLRVNVPRPVKVKAVRKKRKKQKDDDGPATSDAPTVVEMVTENIQPWMVQKWCEEKSICCLWKEGLRGGVKTKY